MNEKKIYVFEDYSYGLVCASYDVEVIKSKLREKYFDELLPYGIRECKKNSPNDEEFIENVIDFIREDIREIEENLCIEDCAYVYSVPMLT